MDDDKAITTVQLGDLDSVMATVYPVDVTCTHTHSISITSVFLSLSLITFVSLPFFSFDITTYTRLSVVLLRCHYHMYVSTLICSCVFLVFLCGSVIDK